MDLCSEGGLGEVPYSTDAREVDLCSLGDREVDLYSRDGQVVGLEGLLLSWLSTVVSEYFFAAATWQTHLEEELVLTEYAVARSSF